jgi:choline dehydrogenase
MYDYVIAGAGSAGCVLADRLSADPAIRVLLLEAGGSDRTPLIHVPAGNLIMLRKGLYCWKYITTPQAHLNNRQLYDPRGKVLGGTSSINGLIYDRGSPSEYDRWAAEGNAGWSYREVLPYFKRSEAYEFGGNAYHGGDGPLKITRSPMTHPMSAAWCEAGEQAGFSFNEDINGAERGGFGPTQMTVSKGRRMSTAYAFLRPARGRKNLTVITGAHATRILFRGTRATGVEYIREGRTEQAMADREVIVSSGVYNTPQLLMLSGLGDPAHLREHGIKPVLDLKGVGLNLHDHMPFSIQVTSKVPITLYGYFNNPFNGLRAGLEYIFLRKGPLAVPPVEVVAIVNSELAQREDPDLKLIMVLAIYMGNGQKIVGKHGFMVRGALLRPDSRGEVRLRSGNPMDMPLVNPNYYATESDRQRVRSGFRRAREVVAQAAFDKYRDVEMTPGPNVNTDDEFDAFVRATTPVDMHAVGSCRMGQDELAVVDETLKVHGIEGLRVVDASIMPCISSGNTNAATIMIGEKGSDMVLGKAPLPPSNVHPLRAA